MKKKVALSKILNEHRRVQEFINKKARTKKGRMSFVESLSYDLNEKCQSDLDLLAELTMRSETPGVYDKYKNIVFKTLGYCVGETL